MRQAEIKRRTKETDISLTLDLDGKGEGKIDTGCGFLDHMLTLFAKHSRFNLDVKCVGDVDVDYHHTVEDIGIALGSALSKALLDKGGITRYADTTLPMDEALVLSAVDISGRSYLGYNVALPTAQVGDDFLYILKPKSDARGGVGVGNEYSFSSTDIIVYIHREILTERTLGVGNII